MLCLSKCECVSITVHTPLCLSPPFKREAGALTLLGRRQYLSGTEGENGKLKRGGESWRRRVNEKFIRLHVPKALLCLPGALGLKLPGRGGGSQPKGW